MDLLVLNVGRVYMVLHQVSHLCRATVQVGWVASGHWQSPFPDPCAGEGFRVSEVVLYPL
jgi:hypothetical protein